MDGQRVSDLGALDERQARALLEELYSALSAEKEHALRHEDYTMEMPQSGESIRGRDHMRTLQESFPGGSTPPSIRIRRVTVRENLWVVEETHDYGGGHAFHGVSVIELRNGRIWRETRYFAQPFEAPAWRRRWVERLER